MEEKIKYRYFATGRTGTTQVYPANGRDFALSYTEIKERLDYKISLTEKLVFKGRDFAWLYYLEKTLYRCDFIALAIEKYCGNAWTPFFSGKMSLNSGDPWNLDKGIVTLEVAESDLYDCIDSGEDKEFNLADLVYPKVIVKTIVGTIEKQAFAFQSTGPSDPADLFPGEPNPYEKGWRQSYIRYNYSNGGIGNPGYSGEVTWAREILLIPIDQAAPDLPWIYIETTGGQKKYARQVILYNSVSSYDPNNPNDFSTSYSIMDLTIDNGLPLRKCIEGMLQDLCPNLTVESDFFQWNPINVSSINYVTDAPSQVKNLVIFQKSDVKRPNANNNATIFKTNFKDLINDICNTFQLKYAITVGNKFKIEHVDYYKESGVGLDTTTQDLAVYTNGNRIYSYDKDSIPKRENFLFMESSYGDFTGVDIIYSGSCAGQGENKTIGYQVENITTDVELCISNPAPDSKVSDDGFVLIAADQSGSIYREPSILGGNVLNNTLSWAYLHKNYWRHNRAQKVFTMNNVLTVAKSVKPTKLQAEFSIPFCCGEFDPKKFIATSLSNNGVLKSANYNIYTEKLSLSVLHSADDGLSENNAPVTIGDSASTFKDTPVIIDVLANDYDDDGRIIPSTLKTVLNTSNGIAEITSNFKIKYTPNSGFVGSDAFVYTVADDFGEISINTLVNISVIDGSPEVVANTDIYTIAKGSTLNVPAPGLLANDTGPSALTCVPETKLTSYGQTVQIFANGSFTYTAPSGSGIAILDTFQYTAKDINNNTDVGQVEIDCFNAEAVYASLVETQGEMESIIEDCSGGSQVTGSHRLSDYRLKFFSDSARTIPLDATPYGIVLHVLYRFYQGATLMNSYTVNYNGTGTVMLIEQELENLRQYQGCSFGQTVTTSVLLSLQPGAGYNI